MHFRVISFTPVVLVYIKLGWVNSHLGDRMLKVILVSDFSSYASCDVLDACYQLKRTHAPL